MSLATFLGRVTQTSWRERLILAEAVTSLAASALAIRLVPFRVLVRKASGAGAGRKHDTQGSALSVEKLHWAIKASAPYLPWKTACFQEGLALHAMLRRRGLASVLHYGVGQSPGRGLTAHVWVSVDGRILIGEEEAGSHACLASFPPAAEQS